MIVCSIPLIIIFRTIGESNIWVFFFISPLLGVMIGGPYNLISTVVSIDLGDNTNAKGAIIRIINGSESLGAAFG